MIRINILPSKAIFCPRQILGPAYKIYFKVRVINIIKILKKEKKEEKKSNLKSSKDKWRWFWIFNKSFRTKFITIFPKSIFIF